MFIALQQGQRLDWWRSGLYNGLFWSGAFFLLCALIRRLRGPNWLVALPYIWRWNTVLLGSLLFWFRFTLCLTIILIPQSLAIHGFEADQIGPAIIWSAAPLLLVAFTGRLLMLSGTGSPVALRRGAGMHGAVGCAERSVHQCVGGRKLLSHRVAHRGRTSLCSYRAGGMHHPAGSIHGGLSKPQWILTFSAFFHTIRLFGGTAGAIYMAHFLAAARETALQSSRTARKQWKLDYRCKHSRDDGWSLRKSSGLPSAGARAVDLIAARLRLQAYTLSLIDGLPVGRMELRHRTFLVAMLRKSPLNYADLARLQPVKEEK